MLILEVINTRNAYGKKELDMFTLSDIRNNVIQFKRLSRTDVYVGTIQEIKNIELAVFTFMDMFKKISNVHQTHIAIDVSFENQGSTDGIIKIYNRYTAMVSQGNLNINWDDAIVEINNKERNMIERRGPFFFKRPFWVFDLAIQGSRTASGFNLTTNIIGLSQIRKGLRLKMFFDKYKHYIAMFLLLQIIVIVETYWGSIFPNVWENIKNIKEWMSSSPPLPPSTPPPDSEYNFFG